MARQIIDAIRHRKCYQGEATPVAKKSRNAARFTAQHMQQPREQMLARSSTTNRIPAPKTESLHPEPNPYTHS